MGFSYFILLVNVFRFIGFTIHGCYVFRIDNFTLMFEGLCYEIHINLIIYSF